MNDNEFNDVHCMVCPDGNSPMGSKQAMEYAEFQQVLRLRDLMFEVMATKRTQRNA